MPFGAAAEAAGEISSFDLSSLPDNSVIRSLLAPISRLSNGIVPCTTEYIFRFASN